MRYVKTTELSEGMRLASPVIGRDGKILLAQNTKLTEFTIGRLKDCMYNGVYIYDKISEDIEIMENLPLDVLVETSCATKDMNLERCLYLAGEITQKLQNTELIRTNIMSLADFDSYTYMHSSNVAMYAGTFGLLLGLPYKKIEQLVMSALLHDIGKEKIEESILNKKGKLTSEEYDEVKKHPQYGYDMLKDLNAIPSVVRVSILQHHENVDGTGYPLGLKDDDIYIFAKIIHICDVYDAMISKRCYKDRINPAEVIEYIMANSGKMFNLALVRIFLTSIVPYPEGVVVNLSDGRQAIVKENLKDYPLRPIIKTFDGEVIDMSEQYNITIVDIDI